MGLLTDWNIEHEAHISKSNQVTAVDGEMRDTVTHMYKHRRNGVYDCTLLLHSASVHKYPPETVLANAAVMNITSDSRADTYMPIARFLVAVARDKGCSIRSLLSELEEHRLVRLTDAQIDEGEANDYDKRD